MEATWADLTAQCPNMCTLQEMHRRVAVSPRTQAKFWLLRDDLVARYLLAIKYSYVGTHRDGRIINDSAIEDDYCSSEELGLAGFAVDEQEPCEAQARGFTHGRRKVSRIPEPIGPEMLREFQASSAGKPEEDKDNISNDDLWNSQPEWMKRLRERVIKQRKTEQQELEKTGA